MKTSTIFQIAFSAALVALVVRAADSDKPKPVSVSFVPFGKGLPTQGQWREGFRIADLNGDGHPDIVHGSQRKIQTYPVIFLGDGKGSWARWKEAKFPDLPYDYGDIEVADFNRDGHLDLAIAIHLHGMLVLDGDGKGVFTNASTGLDYEGRSASAFSSRAIRVLDWNGDGLPDLIALSEGPRPSPALGINLRGIVVYLNQGKDGWRRSEKLLSPGVFADSIALGDFDGDGHLDVATGSSAMGRTDLVNLWRKGGEAQLMEVPFPNQFHYAQAVAAGDFDKDGKDDLVVSYLSLENEIWYAVIDLLYSRPGGKWERRNLFKEVSREPTVAMATGHLRDKKTRDLVALTTKGETIVFLGDGHGGLVRNTPELPIEGGGCRGAHVELADLDGDGLDEIVASFADESPTCPSGGGFAVWKVGQPERPPAGASSASSK